MNLTRLLKKTLCILLTMIMVLPVIHLKAENNHQYDAWYYISYGADDMGKGTWRFVTKGRVNMENRPTASRRIYTDDLEHRIQTLDDALLVPITYQGITYDVASENSQSANTYTIEWKRIIDENGANNAGKDNVPAGVPAYHVDGQVTFHYQYDVEYYISGVKNDSLTQKKMVSFTSEIPQSLSYEILSIEGYALSHVENKDLKVGDSQNIIKVYYDVDQLGENGPDGIPDQYQALISFKVENGQWNDGTSEEIQKVVTFKDINGNLDQYGEAILELPTVGMRPLDGYKQGQWDIKTIPHIIKPTDPSSYVYQYELNRFEYHIEYYYDGVLGDTPIDEYKNKDALFGTTIKLDPAKQINIGNKNYVLVSDEHDIKVSSDADLNVIRVFYATDMIGENGPDGIPDYYQVRVDFEAENGVLDGNRYVYITLKDESGNLNVDGIAHLQASQIPTAVAQEGFGHGVWDEEPTELLDIKEDTTFVIRFSENPEVPTIETPDDFDGPMTDETPNDLAEPTINETPVINIPETETPLSQAEENLNEFVEIEEPEIPLARAYGSWSLVNVVIVMVNILLSVMIILMKSQKEHKMWLKIFSIALSLGSILLLLFTQNFDLFMVWVDSWTGILIISMLIHISI